MIIKPVIKHSSDDNQIHVVNCGCADTLISRHFNGRWFLTSYDKDTNKSSKYWFPAIENEAFEQALADFRATQ